MYKKTLFAAAVLTLTTSAFAQLNAPAKAPAAQAPTAVVMPAAPAAPVAAPVAAPGPVVGANIQGVNPFVGKSLSLETHQQALETSKMATALMEEQFKQATLAEDLRTLPMKKQVEMAQATTARMKEELSQKEVQQGPKKALVDMGGAAPAEKAKPKVRPAKKVAKVASPVTAPTPAPVARTIPVEVTSILNFDGVRSAVLDFDGNILSAKQGDATPLGTVEILDDQSVRIGARTYKVHGSTLARVVISDPKPVDPLKMVQTPVPAPAAAVAPGAAPASFPPPAQLPASRNGQPTLPPLQLPAGVTLLPPTAR